MRRSDLLEMTIRLGKIEGRRRRVETEDEMVGWHHQLDGYEFEQALGVSNGHAREPWHAEDHWVAKSQTRLSN